METTTPTAPLAHTPGPWHIGAGNGSGSIFADSGRKRFEAGGTTLYPICMMNTGYIEGEDEANARLIAAAPDLLAALNASTIALQDFQREAGMQTHPKLNWQIMENLTLINKAKGIAS